MSADDKTKETGFEKAGFEEAVALAQDRTGRGAPRVTAHGRGQAARELIRLALEYKIPVRYDPDLVQVLARLDLGEEIPEEIYVVVAELLAFIYVVNQEFGTGPWPGK
ncbi:MAG: EscU/YscU/HrcU family type III secretion system export apparatus switch protein [Thermodesulfobacteriota bacterium]